jgi:hypothetical protein
MNDMVVGLGVPAVVFLISYIATELLYRHFSKKGNG